MLHVWEGSLIYGAMHLTIKIAVNMPPKSAISQFERRYPMHPQLKVERPTWKIKSMPYRLRTHSVRRVWDRTSHWVYPVAFVLVLLVLCALVGE